MNKQKALLELCEREKLYYTPYENYRRNYKLRPITSKFYARHEGPTQVGEIIVTVDEINEHIATGPKEHNPWPATENQVYGWFSEPLVKINVNDRRLVSPHLSHEFIRHELQMQKDRHFQKVEKFTGVPFLLQ